MKIKLSKKGSATLITVLGMGTALGVMVMQGMQQASQQSKQMAKALSEVERAYAQEMSAIAAYNSAVSSGDFSTSTRTIDTFTNSYAGLVNAPAGNLDRGVSSLSQTAGADSGTAMIRRLASMTESVKNTDGNRLYCGSASLSEGNKATSYGEQCLSQNICAGSIPKACYSGEPIAQLYRSTLGRTATAAEIDAWALPVASGAQTLGEVEGLIRASASYLARAPLTCTNVAGSASTTLNATERAAVAMAVENVTGMFRGILGRYPSLAEAQEYAIHLTGCPRVAPARAAMSVAAVIAELRALPEFSAVAGNNGRLHAEPIRELMTMMLGRDPAIADNGFAADFTSISKWLGRLANQNPTINPVVSTDPPYEYGSPATSYGPVGGPLGGVGALAMLIQEIESNPPAPTPRVVTDGLTETPEYAANGGGQGEVIIGLFRVLLGRAPKGPNPSPDMTYYLRLMNTPYNMPPSYLSQVLMASGEFGGKGSGCSCASKPAPLCKFVPSVVKAKPGDSVSFTLYAYDNAMLDPGGFVHVGNPPSTWDGSNGTIRSVIWDTAQTISPGAMSFTKTRIAGGAGTKINETAVISGPGGSVTCTASVDVESAQQTCTLFQSKRGPGAYSRWQFGGAGDNNYPQGPYSAGGAVATPHDFYNWWAAYIPGRPASEFSWAGNFRTGAGYNNNVPVSPTTQGNYDPCNRNYGNCWGPYTHPEWIIEMPARFTYMGIPYQFMTRLSDGTAQTFANGGVCGSKDCFCYLSGVVSPLIIDFAGAGIKLKPGVYFDMGKGRKDKFWPANGDAVGFLAIDLNGDGNINNVHELFGSETRGPDGKKAANGFDALGKFNKNGDSVISADDAIYANLRVWFDRNRNGRAESEELVTLPEVGVEEISLYYRDVDHPLDPFGNVVKQESRLRMADGRILPIVDAWLADGNPADSKPPQLSKR